MPATVLIVEDEKNAREGLRCVLELEYDVYIARNAEEAFRLLSEDAFDVVLTDLRMAGESGMRVIEKVVSMPNKPILHYDDCIWECRDGGGSNEARSL